MVFSNLPGENEPLMIGKEPLLAVQAIFPNLLPQSILLSYNHSIYSNLVVDPAFISDADKELLQVLWREELLEMADTYDIRDKGNIFTKEQHLL